MIYKQSSWLTSMHCCVCKVTYELPKCTCKIKLCCKTAFESALYTYHQYTCSHCALKTKCLNSYSANYKKQCSSLYCGVLNTRPRQDQMRRVSESLQTSEVKWWTLASYVWTQRHWWKIAVSKERLSVALSAFIIICKDLSDSPLRIELSVPSRIILLRAPAKLSI